MRSVSTLPLIALSLAASPLAAQTFSLPPGPSSTPTPEVEGPADDSGVVPVRPRAIRTPTPTPTPAPATRAAPTPAPSATNTPATRPTLQPAPTPTPSRSPAATPTIAPQLPADLRPAETPAPANETELPTTNGGLDLPALPQGQPATPTTPELDDTGIAWWAWLLAGIAALAALGGGMALMRRRAALAGPPVIEPPVVGGGDAAGPIAAGEKARVDLQLEVERVSRSVMVLMLRYRLDIANRSGRAIRDLEIHAELGSAGNDVPLAQQLAMPDSALPLVETIERIGPHQSRSISGTLQVPINDLSVIMRGNTPLFVPLLKLVVSAPAMDTVAETHMAGIGGPGMSTKLQPLTLEGPPGGYNGVRSRKIER